MEIPELSPNFCRRISFTAACRSGILAAHLSDHRVAKEDRMISRRQMLALAGAAPLWSVLKPSAEAQAPRTPIAKLPPLQKAIRAWEARPRPLCSAPWHPEAASTPFDMIEHCRSIGLGGVQMNPPSTDPEEIKKFRQRLEDYGMHLVCDPRLPRQESDLAAFDAQVKAYKEAGAAAFHAAMTGRRYEDFDRLEPFKQMFEQCRKQVELAEPVLRKVQDQARHRKPQGLAFRRAGGVAEASRQRMGRRLPRFRQ